MAANAARLMSSLPEEIQVEILLKLPAKSLFSCKCVCKFWLNLISSPKFIDDHLNIQNENNHKIMVPIRESCTSKPLIYSIDSGSISSSPDLSCKYKGNEANIMDYPFEYKEGMEIRVLGSCNGLICFGLLFDDIKPSICIWNPTTREFMDIQDSDVHITRNSAAGVGYDSRTGDYKLVVTTNSRQFDYCVVEVYTFGSHSSKTIKTFPYKFSTRVTFSGVFLNGALHWIDPTWKQDTPNCMISFDISNEKLMDVPLPVESIIHPEDSNTILYQKLGVIGDCLSLVLVDKELGQAEVWVMHEYGVRESWIKLFTSIERQLTRQDFWRPLLVFKNGEILMYTFEGFALCDPMNERVYEARIECMLVPHPESYVESLVSLNSGTYVKKPKGQNTR